MRYPAAYLIFTGKMYNYFCNKQNTPLWIFWMLDLYAAHTAQACIAYLNILFICKLSNPQRDEEQILLRLS